MLTRVLSYLTDVALGRRRGIDTALLSPFLFLLSFLYAAVVVFLRWLYLSGALSSFRAPVPAISVGNITAGGTGKTPFVVMLSGVMKEEGYDPMILIRGFMKDHQGFSDEAEMLKESVGSRVFCGPDRVRSFWSGCQAGKFNAVILDDGFQHWRFKRDLDIVLLDSRTPFGNGSLIPRGILREPLSVLRHAGIIVLTRSDRATPAELTTLEDRLKRLFPQAVLCKAVHRVKGIRHAFSGLTFSSELSGDSAAFCAIGDPESFRETLLSTGVTLKFFISFEDHYCFDERDIINIIAECREKKVGKVFTTHKDLVKLHRFRDHFVGLELIVFDIELVLTYGKNEFISIVRRLRRP